MIAKRILSVFLLVVLSASLIFTFLGEVREAEAADPCTDYHFAPRDRNTTIYYAWNASDQLIGLKVTADALLCSGDGYDPNKPIDGHRYIFVSVTKDADNSELGNAFVFAENTPTVDDFGTPQPVTVQVDFSSTPMNPNQQIDIYFGVRTVDAFPLYWNAHIIPPAGSRPFTLGEGEGGDGTQVDANDDDDNDGVPNVDDVCPNQYGEGDNGCPLGSYVPSLWEQPYIYGMLDIGLFADNTNSCLYEGILYRGPGDQWAYWTPECEYVVLGWRNGYMVPANGPVTSFEFCRIVEAFKTEPPTKVPVGETSCVPAANVEEGGEGGPVQGWVILESR